MRKNFFWKNRYLIMKSQHTCHIKSKSHNKLIKAKSSETPVFVLIKCKFFICSTRQSSSSLNILPVAHPLTLVYILSYLSQVPQVPMVTPLCTYARCSCVLDSPLLSMPSAISSLQDIPQMLSSLKLYLKITAINNLMIL